jgi:hypothetical protein
LETYYVAEDDSPFERIYEAKVVRTGAGITLTVTPVGEPDLSFSYDLEPISKRFGLAVAAGN